MEEKFYYSRRFVWSTIVSSLPALAMGFMMLFIWFRRLGASQWSNEKLDWFAAAVASFLLSFILIFAGLMRFREVLEPAIMITNRKIVFSPSSTKASWKARFNFHKLGLGYEQIVSASIRDVITPQPGKTDKAIEVKFRRPTGREDSFYVFISKISKQEKLIELLKQRIKFV